MVTCQPFSASPRSVIDALVIVSGFEPAQPPKEIPGSSLFFFFLSQGEQNTWIADGVPPPFPFELEPRLSRVVGDGKGNREEAMISR